MSATRSSSRWRELDLAQMPFWPNSPRRWTLALIALLLLLILGLNTLLPRLSQLDGEQHQTQQLQQQIHQLYQTSPQLLTNLPPVRPIRHAEESAWLAGLATQARNHSLSRVDISNHDLTDAERVKFREYIQNTTPSSLQLINKDGLNLPLDWLDQVGWVQIDVQGSYTDVLSYAADLGMHDEWLAVNHVTTKAVDENQVHWQISFWYLKEATPKSEARDGK